MTPTPEATRHALRQARPLDLAQAIAAPPADPASGYDDQELEHRERAARELADIVIAAREPASSASAPTGDAAARQSDPARLAATKLVLDVAFGVGGLSEAYCLADAAAGDEAVVLFCERTADGLHPLAEIHRPRDGYRDPVGEETHALATRLTTRTGADGEPAELIRVVFTEADVDCLAESLHVPAALARERAESWARGIRDTATELVNQQLASVIRHNQP